jgi:hypothetical protein
MAKNITLAMILIIFGVGLVGSFITTFNMIGFIAFIKGFSTMYIPLIASIGFNSGLKKMKEKKE